MRLPFDFSLASLITGVMVGVAAGSATAGDYEDAQKLLAAQKWSEALPMLKELNEDEPESITIAQDLGQVLLRLNRREEALEILKKYRLNRQADIAARAFISKESFRFYQQGLDWLMKHVYPQACERLEHALEKDQAHLDVLLRLAQCEVLDGNADLALKFLDQLERIHGKTPETQLWRARAAALRNHFEEALPIFTALAGGPKNPEPTNELIPLWWGEALLASGKKTEALATFESDAKANPAHLQTALAAIRLRLAQAESPHQLLAVDRDLTAWEKLLAARLAQKPKRGAEFVFDPFDAEAIQRTANDTRQQLRAVLPTPTPSPSAASSSPRPSKV
ncbi:MAG: tetratricopeptide repeat protein [Bdellovibrionales bacterium]|nr:tetratricopeptide repeat protein [Bdellovibrionales bacterium]